MSDSDISLLSGSIHITGVSCESPLTKQVNSASTPGSTVLSSNVVPENVELAGQWSFIRLLIILRYNQVIRSQFKYYLYYSKDDWFFIILPVTDVSRNPQRRSNSTVAAIVLSCD